MRAAQHRRLVGGEVQDAIRHNDVEGARLQFQLIKGFDEALVEFHVGFREPEGLGMKGLVAAGDLRITSYNVCYTKLLRSSARCSIRGAELSSISSVSVLLMPAFHHEIEQALCA